MSSVQPGSTLGIVGGGQLARMTTMAARSMGYRVHIYDPDVNCSASGVANFTQEGTWDDISAMRRFAATCDVVTIDIEKISVEALAACAEVAPVRPSPALLAMVQNKSEQKRWLQQNGFPVGPFGHADSEKKLAELLAHFGRSFVKADHGGYDGRGQVIAKSPDEAARVWRDLGSRSCVVEQALDLEYEVSVLVARRPSGDVAVYPPAYNHHVNQILDWSVMPARIEAEVSARAEELASEIATAVALEGLLVVEMFVTKDGQVLVNELAPRPHNSYHGSERACVTGQFEQLVRAVCDVPLGSTEIVTPTAITNLLGDLWQKGTPDFAAAMSDPNVRVHLYEKSGARPGRKMGHLSAVGATQEEALASVRRARHLLLHPEQKQEETELVRKAS